MSIMNTMNKPLRLFGFFLFAGILSASPAFAAGPSISPVTPASATADVPVTLSATVTSGAGIKSCNLYVDLDDKGAMDISGNTASKSYTFPSGGSRIAFVFCKDNSGGMASGPNTAIWVAGAIVNTGPMTGSGSQTETPSQTPSQSQTPTTTTQTPPAAVLRTLVKTACAEGAAADDPCKAVYYVGADGKRHAYPNSKVFFTWYSNFDAVETVTPEKLASYPLGKNVAYRPGVRMVKFTTLDKVYAVGRNGVLRWIASEDVAKALYGDDWNTKIDDIPDTFYMDYTFGSDIASSSDFVPATESAAAPTFD